MGRDLCEGSAAARAVFDTADHVLGYTLSEVCFEGPEEQLRETEYTQPAIFATSLACLAAAIESGAIASAPAFMAGHSLGEYTALVAAGALSLEDGLRLLAGAGPTHGRGRSAEPRARMAAILGLDEDAVRAICADADVDVCNLNLPTQTVIGGTPRGRRAGRSSWRRSAAPSGPWSSTSAAPSTAVSCARRVPGLIDGGRSGARCGAPVVPVVANASATPLDERRRRCATSWRRRSRSRCAGTSRLH